MSNLSIRKKVPPLLNNLNLLSGSGWQNHGGRHQNTRGPEELAGAGVRWPGSAASSEARFTQQHIVHPRIDRARSSDGNVSVLVGKQVLLRCVIDDLGNESVSALREGRDRARER